MAPRLVPITAGLVICGLTLGPLFALIAHAGIGGSLLAADWAALRFTVMQAAVSAVVSVILAVPVARALIRRQFWGRGFVLALLGAPFILPVIVAILGLLAIFGQNGLLNIALAEIGLPKLSIYGAHGVILAHVFFNLPLAVRMVLFGWQAIPAEQVRLAHSLGLARWTFFQVLEWPMLKRVLPSACAVIFVICLSSFAVALTLGGGPKATTVELALYQAFRYDFDFEKVAMLGMVQMGLSLGAAMIAISVRVPVVGQGLDRTLSLGETGWPVAVWDAAWICIALAFLGLPIASVVVDGIGGLWDLPQSVWPALGRSLWMALISSALAVALGAALASRTGEILATLAISMSGLVLGSGLFFILRAWVNPFDFALFVTVLMNALMSVPFVVRILRPTCEATVQNYGRLARSLGLGWPAWGLWVALPRMRRALGFSLGLSAALSIGDLGVIALFGSAETATLPLVLYQLMGSYKIEAASGAALLLMMAALALFMVFDRWGQNARA